MLANGTWTKPKFQIHAKSFSSKMVSVIWSRYYHTVCCSELSQCSWFISQQMTEGVLVCINIKLFGSLPAALLDTAPYYFLLQFGSIVSHVCVCMTAHVGWFIQQLSFQPAQQLPVSVGTGTTQKLQFSNPPLGSSIYTVMQCGTAVTRSSTQSHIPFQALRTVESAIVIIKVKGAVNALI